MKILNSNISTFRFRFKRKCKNVIFMIVACIILTVFLQDISNTIKYSMFSDPSDLQEWDDHIQIVMVLKGLNDRHEKGFDLRTKFKNFLKSAVIETRAYPIRFIFIADILSVFQIDKIFQDVLPPFELTNQVNNSRSELSVSRFHRDYVNIETIVDLVDPWSVVMNEYFNNPFENLVGNSNENNVTYKIHFKYNDTLFFFGAYYQRMFPNLNKLIFLDTDVEFRMDPAKLFREFDQFSAENIFGCAIDLAPHYYTTLFGSGYYKKYPNSRIGTPGRLQGLNSGVLLLRLDRMRENIAFNHYLSNDGVTELAFKYGFTNTSIGAQDWLTLVSFDNPNLVYPLDCKFNRQMNLYEIEIPWIEDVWKYNSCHEKKTYDSDNTFIVHLNGNSEYFTFNDYLADSYLQNIGFIQ